MAKQKVGVKAEPTTKQPVAVKRKRGEITDSYKKSKKARISKPDGSRPAKTSAVKQETQDCDICAESRPTYRNFPSLPTCSHDATVCSSCYERHFVTRINDNREQGWSACTCPLCGEKVESKDAQGILPRQVSKELDAMIKNVEKQTALNWIWCPGRNCGHGQLHNLGSSNIVNCRHCLSKICYKHQCIWHQGFTCDEFDQIGDQDANTAKSIEEIRRTTKPCPHCKTRIKKDGGCNHMICTGCHKHWLWDTVRFDGEETATTAEVRGGPAQNRPLEGGARQAVEQVMQFENAHVDQARATTGPQAGRNPLRPTAQLDVTPGRGFFRIAVDGFTTLTTFLRPNSPNGRPAPRPAPRLEERAGVVAERRAELERLQQEVRQNDRQQPWSLTRLFGTHDQVRQQSFPVSNMRSTQTSPARQRQSPARARRQDQTRTRTRVTPNAPLIVLDDSDVEIDTVGGQSERRNGRNQAGRGQNSRGTEVIDLTDDDTIIDLTEDD